MSKDQVWKIIFFFHINNPKKIIFPDFSRLENNQKNFHTFQDCIGTVNTRWSNRIYKGLVKLSVTFLRALRRVHSHMGIDSVV